MNHEGYKDPTADKALHRFLIIKDRRTGRKFKVENETNQQR